jgi:cell division protein FtsB
MPNLWTTLQRLTLYLIGAALLVAAGLRYMPLLKSNQARRAENVRKRENLAAMQVRHQQLQASIKSLETDPKAVERAARDILGLARPGEVVISFESPRR